MNTQIYDEICKAVETVKASEYAKLVILFLQYIRWYCCGDAPSDLPDSVYEYVVKGKWSNDPLIDALCNSDVSDETQFLACYVLNAAVAEANGELIEEVQEPCDLIFELLYE